MTIQFLALMFFICSALFFLVAGIALWTYLCFKTDFLDRHFGRRPQRQQPEREYEKPDCTCQECSPDLYEQPKRIERQPKYDVLKPEVKRIECKPPALHLPTAKERVALPVNRKTLKG